MFQKASESSSEAVINPAVVESRYNGLEFCPHMNGKSRDFATPMLMRTEGGDMFEVKSGGGSGKTSVAGFDAPFIESKIQKGRGKK